MPNQERKLSFNPRARVIVDRSHIPPKTAKTAKASKPPPIATLYKSRGRFFWAYATHRLPYSYLSPFCPKHPDSSGKRLESGAIVRFMDDPRVGKEFRYEGQEKPPPKMDGEKWFVVLFLAFVVFCLISYGANPE